MSTAPLERSGSRGASTRNPEAAAFALDPVFSGRRRVANLAGVGLWLAALLFFWVWWLDPDHVVTPGRYAAVTVVLLWITLVPAYFIILFHRARTPRRTVGPPPGARIAMVVTKTPSEPFAIARKTLEAALSQEGCAHDTWLADEAPEAETVDWCRAHGVQISSRKGAADYHRETWPRRRNCKEGNLAYFYDHYGYDRYDFVSQFDVDHVPGPEYLKHALAPFADQAVGYVSAPSICDSNAGASWAARGRLYIEASMHGALQAGYNAGWAPLCIGSHYTVRTCALRAAGGLGPELAEDHSTTLILNAEGWRGVHAIDAIAHGQGPETFTDLVVQEFQWSRSLVTILIKHLPERLGRLPPRLKFQFLFSELWYPSYSLILALSFAMPIWALLTRSHFVDVTYIDYFLHILPLSTVLVGLAYWWRSTGLFRPADARILSWEGVAFIFLRWPWALIGSLTAVWDCATGRKVEFRITPKGAQHTHGIPFRILAPYVALAAASAGCAWLVKDPGSAAGFYLFNLINAVGYAGLVVLVLARHAYENRRPMFPPNLGGALAALSLLGIAGLIGLAAHENGPRGVLAMNSGVHAFSLVEVRSPPAGAGQRRQLNYRLRFKWNGLDPSAPDGEPAEDAASRPVRPR